MKKNLFQLLIFMMAFICSCEKEQNNPDEQPLPPIGGDTELIAKENGVIRIVTYNVGIFSKYMKNSDQVVASMMQELKTDAMVLNELDNTNTRHNYNQVQQFADLMGWQSVFGASIEFRGGHYGNGVAFDKKFKMYTSSVIPLPKIAGPESRSCIYVEFKDFVLAGTHLDDVSEDDRVAAAKKITIHLKEKYLGKGKPVFLCGDMNAQPDSQVLKEFRKDWTVLTPEKNSFPSTNPYKCLDYVLALKGTGDFELVKADVCSQFKHGNVKQASDHLPVFVDVKLNVKR